MSVLHLPVKGEYFHQMKAGTKKFEYRLQTDYWKKRLVDREYSQVKVKLGYPKADDEEKILTVEYRGYEEQVITHPHFGEEPVSVFAIRIN